MQGHPIIHLYLTYLHVLLTINLAHLLECAPSDPFCLCLFV